MSTTAKPAIVPTAKRGDSRTDQHPAKTNAPRQNFVAMAVDMSWQLAIAVLVPVIGGVELDKALKTSEVFTLIGLGVALIASGAVMWRTMQAANKLPVPKLSAAQKKAIKKSYEEDDD